MRYWLFAGVLVLNRLAAAQQAPLPDLKQLQAAAVANYDTMTAQRERYMCREKIIGKDLDGKGRLKKVETTEREQFFVNGHTISQLLTREGKPLTPDERRKQDDAVKKEIEKASKSAKANGGNRFSGRDVLKSANLSNERRTDVAGRPTIIFDVRPDLENKGGSVLEKFVHALEGTISIDEESGRIQDINVRGMRDVKIGGGLVANIHKGFAFHQVTAPQPDGVWLLKVVEGKGEARIGLFLKEAGEFRQETEGCQLYDVSTTQTDGKALPSTPK